MSSPSQMPVEARGLGQAFFNITSFLSRTERFGTVPWTESSRPMRRTRKDQVVALVSLSIAEFDVDCLLARHLSGPLCQVVGSFWKQQEVSPYFPTSLCGVLVFWLPSRPTPPVLPFLLHTHTIILRSSDTLLLISHIHSQLLHTHTIIL